MLAHFPPNDRVDKEVTVMRRSIQRWGLAPLLLCFVAIPLLCPVEESAAEEAAPTANSEPAVPHKPAAASPTNDKASPTNGKARPNDDGGRDGAFDVILSIRRRHGNVFAGSILDTDHGVPPSDAAENQEQEFARILNRIAERHQQDKRHQQSVQQQDRIQAISASTPLQTPGPGTAANHAPNDAFSGPPSLAADAISDSTLLGTLQRASRQLEQRGSMLEEGGQFDKADRLRRLARRIRRETRQLMTPPRAERVTRRPR